MIPKELLDLRLIERAQAIFEWQEQVGQSAEILPAERKLLEAIDQHLAKEYPDVHSELVSPPPGRIRRRGDRLAVLAPGRLTVNANFTGAHKRRPDLACKWMRDHWMPILDAFVSQNRDCTFLALICEMEMSTEGTDCLEGEIVGSFVTVPNWGPVADAEFRVGCEVDGRYYVNLGLSSFQNVELEVQGPQPGEENVRVRQSLGDHGLKVRIDANTKVNVLKRTGPIKVDQKDFERASSLVLATLTESVVKLGAP